MVERLSDVTCRVKDEERNVEQVVHIDRMKVCHPRLGDLDQIGSEEMSYEVVDKEDSEYELNETNNERWESRKGARSVLGKGKESQEGAREVVCLYIINSYNIFKLMLFSFRKMPPKIRYSSQRYRCLYCGIGFWEMSRMSEYCSKLFGRMSNLCRHIRRTHTQITENTLAVSVAVPSTLPCDEFGPDPDIEILVEDGDFS